AALFTGAAHAAGIAAFPALGTDASITGSAHPAAGLTTVLRGGTGAGLLSHAIWPGTAVALIAQALCAATGRTLGLVAREPVFTGCTAAAAAECAFRPTARA